MFVLNSGVCVCVFVDAGELSESRGATNHPVAGIHYYHREPVPKSTPGSASLSLRLLVLQVKVVEHFFFHLSFLRLSELERL